jgi:O-antigen/teichoic acid export membrane protein
MQSVAFPAFYKHQTETSGLERALHKFCEMSAFFSLPAFTGIMIVAPELVHCLFGAKWMAAVPILQVLAVYGCLRVSWIHAPLDACPRSTGDCTY